VDEALGIGPWKDGLHVLPAFGHTEGSVMFYHAPSRTLFSGDAILAGLSPIRRLGRLSLAEPAFSIDAAECHRHVRRFLDDPPAIDFLCSGHGPLVDNDVRNRLRALRAQRPGL